MATDLSGVEGVSTMGLRFRCKKCKNWISVMQKDASQLDIIDVPVCRACVREKAQLIVSRKADELNVILDRDDSSAV